MTTIAIIGGGPGGLLAAYFLTQKCPKDCDITVFEASGRLGGKVLSRRFTEVSVPYEAGVAELYDYSALGPKPHHNPVYTCDSYLLDENRKSGKQ